jgi:hypothetical protein
VGEPATRGRQPRAVLKTPAGVKLLRECAYSARTGLPPESAVCSTLLQTKKVTFAATFSFLQSAASCRLRCLQFHRLGNVAELVLPDDESREGCVRGSTVAGSSPSLAGVRWVSPGLHQMRFRGMSGTGVTF